MPRGQNSKLRAREKRRQARGETQGPSGAQATAAEVRESPISPVSGGTPSSSPAAGCPQKPQGAPAARSRAAGVSRPRSHVGAKSQVEESENSSQASTSTQSPHDDLLTRKVGLLIEFLLDKYQMKEPIKRADMLKLVHKRYREHFPEILRRVSERIELVFGLYLKEVKPSGLCYTLVGKLDLREDGSLSDDWGFPKSGLLMPLLGVIFLKHNRASEEEIWEFLNMLGIYDGRRHFIFGEPRKVITQDLVQEKYLEYRQVPNSAPPRYEFRWGPRAHAETSKMKVLEFVAKVNGTVPSAFPSYYEEALRDGAERARARPAARAATTAKASARSRATSSRYSHPK
ncbi:melanoma-associated antigen B1-like [Diceros bicornis minor]|uniref:melanoma-associated antigen B1-like n=1 Tax=Diceros bicornis minor TaxID=77932 RepID=UPI0026ECD824|nr:melanoma-associated antigen B1-like [Diceros bicornis minor]XP_058391175.1 melanoma-associated antigen B1-like [Diceros bicornis minor]